MNYQIEAVQNQNYILAKATGTIDAETFNQMILDAASAASEHGYTKYLIDMQEAYFNISTLEIVNFATYLRRTELKLLHKIALIYSQDEKDYHFIETVVRNRGYNIRIFDHSHEAISWLLGERYTTIGSMN